MSSRLLAFSISIIALAVCRQFCYNFATELYLRQVSARVLQLEGASGCLERLKRLDWRAMSVVKFIAKLSRYYYSYKILILNGNMWCNKIINMHISIKTKCLKVFVIKVPCQWLKYEFTLQQRREPSQSFSSTEHAYSITIKGNASCLRKKTLLSKVF